MYKKVNEIYSEILSKKISIQDGSKQIIECVFLAPSKFGLHFMKPDQKSDFIVFLLTHMPRYIENYSISRAQFSTYLMAIILNMKKSWYRQYYRNTAQEQSLQNYCTSEELIIEDSENCSRYLSGYVQKPAKKYEIRGIKQKKAYPLRLLILSLKACYYLTPEYINLIAKKTGYTEEDIHQYKHDLEELMQKKIERHKINEHRINSAFIKKNRCLIELMTLQPESPLAQRVKKAHSHYTYMWQRKIKQYNDCPRVRPTNEEIGQVLNMKQHQIYQALHQIKKQHTVINKYPLEKTKKT